MLQFRNPAYNVSGTIDMEIETPDFGWIPFTASPNDATDYGPALYAAAVAAGNVAPYVAPVVVPVVPDSVSARQFHVQLGIAGLRDQVSGWIAAQSVEVQDSFEYSGSFLRSEPMMASGFTELGYTSAQIDAFFTAAALL
ncbi:hypothetical protein [Mesorhizobium sp. M7A.F.Ca.MR.148.00.0.0]|uniref:hypothetical protein n=1 Tax=Mesorhizobium sp. M7A.F.Ca.MR.148.00.0.0 TaxID=2496775 RepID=UPI001FE1D46C|nr:hypothetical protein [Mesorhizobium sp. M7A.F.Ca.MR.148.00.0.0]